MKHDLELHQQMEIRANGEYTEKPQAFDYNKIFCQKSAQKCPFEYIEDTNVRHLLPCSFYYDLGSFFLRLYLK